MSRYFFNIHDGRDFVDDEGSDFPDLESARTEAVILAADMLKDAASIFWEGEEWFMEVADAHGLILFTLRFTGTMALATRS